ncbi:MAG TPA: hypothetical protein VIH62_07510, partial [Xanthobacteraceae bacterium]
MAQRGRSPEDALCQEWRRYGRGAVMDQIAANLAAVRARIEAAARAAGRPADAVNLVAVSKTHPANSVRAALETGQRIFGENRVQEVLAKFPGLRGDYPDL